MPIAYDDLNKYDKRVIESVKYLAIRETRRMKDFASIAENPYDSDALVAEIKRVFEIDDDLNTEVEDYE